MDASELLTDVRLLPVVVIEDVASAEPLARALGAAGIGAIEITLRTSAGLAAIEQLASAMPELLLGAGSVLDEQQLRQVMDAGAKFAVSPGHTDAILAAATGFPYLPGAVSASESMHLLAHGYRLQKFFPAEPAGGVATIRALSAPLPTVRYCVTGGINPGNVADYLACPAVACIGGSWFVPGEALRAGDYPRIEQLAREAMALTASSG